MSKRFDARFSFPSREESFELRNAVLSTEDENDVQKSSVRTILNSNLWDLQTKELLDEVTVDYRKIKWIENKLREIKGVITNLKNRKKSEIATTRSFPSFSTKSRIGRVCETNSCFCSRKFSTSKYCEATCEH